MKTFLRLLVLLTAAMLLLCSCAAKPKTFSCEGLQMELTSRFREVKQEGCTALYSTSGEVAVLQKEPFESLADLGLDANSTLEEYAAVVIKANDLSDIEVQTEDGLTFFIYQSEVDGTTYCYLATAHKSGDAFWLVQFSTAEKNFSDQLPIFTKYAKTVCFG